MSGVAEWDRGPFDVEDSATCETCRFWTENVDDRELDYPGSKKYKPGFGKCDCEKIHYVGGYEEDETKQTSDTMLYWDSEGYAAGMRTGKDFGCIHHEVKE